MRSKILASALIFLTILSLTACGIQYQQSLPIQTATPQAEPANTLSPSSETNTPQESTPITQTPMKILIVIAANGYQDTEYSTPKAILEKAGYEVVTTSTKEVAKGSLGGKTTVDVLMDKVNPADYGAVVFIGGPGSHDYFAYEPAITLAKDFYNAGKLTTAICAAPSILANAGILEGKTVTAFPDEAMNVKNKGATYTGNAVEQDGLIITGNGPEAAKAFGEKIVEALTTP
jgi:protease I